MLRRGGRLPKGEDLTQLGLYSIHLYASTQVHAAFIRGVTCNSCTKVNAIFCYRVTRRKARHARELSRVTAAKQGDTLEATWGNDTTDEDDGEVARYARERNQIMEVCYSDSVIVLYHPT